MVRATGSTWRAVGRRGRVLTVSASLVVVAVAAGWVPRSIVVVATGVSLLVLVVAALVDAVTHRLPNALVAVAAVPVLVTLVPRVRRPGRAAPSSAPHCWAGRCS